MAPDPIPEFLNHQEVDEERQVELAQSRSKPRLSDVPPRTDREFPSTRLRHAAEVVGTTLGQAVNAARQTRNKVAETGYQSTGSVQSRVQTIRERASGALTVVQENAGQAYEGARRRTETSYDKTRVRAVEIIKRVRRRARYLANEYPLELIAAVAGAAFLTGVLLRIWRSRRDE